MMYVKEENRILQEVGYIISHSKICALKSML